MGSPLQVTYGYDLQDRLISANATGGPADTLFAESYTYDTNGRLATKGPLTLQYAAQSAACPNGALQKPHTVTKATSGGGTNTYCYNSNGNMVSRTVGGVTVNFGYSAENQLTSVTATGLNEQFTYDGDGVRVKQVGAGGATVTLASGYEWVIPTGGTPYARLYYAAGSQRVGMRENGTRCAAYLLTNQLGSTLLTVDRLGNVVHEQRYRPYGETLWASGAAPTKHQFTGQRLESLIGLYDYGARWYDPYLNRFLSPDPIVPDLYNPQDWDRYSYARNNPVKYTDPTGHAVKDPGDESAWWDEIDIEWIYENSEDDVEQNYWLVMYMVENPDYDANLDPYVIESGWDPDAFNAQMSVIKGIAGAYIMEKNPALSLGDYWAGYAPGLIAGGVVLGGGPSGSLLTLDDLSYGAALPDRNGFTRAGRALQKHGNRAGSAFPNVKGNPTTINEAGQFIVDDILTTPGSTVKQYYRPGYGNVVDVRAPDGRGLRFDANSGILIGFLEP